MLGAGIGITLMIAAMPFIPGVAGIEGKASIEGIACE
jgi:hypothetical protein